MLLIPSMISVPIIGVIAFIAFLSTASRFQKPTKEKKFNVWFPRIFFLFVAFLEAIRYIANGIISLRLNLKFSCSLCSYGYYNLETASNMYIHLHSISTSEGYFLFAMNYIITPLYLLLLGIVLLLFYLKQKDRGKMNL